MEEKQIKLDGSTVNEQVNNFMSLLKDKTISVEELERLIPLNIEFVKGLLDVIQKETEADKEGYASYLQVMNNMIDHLRKICEGQSLSSEERKQILDYIYKLGEMIKEVELNRENNHTKRVGVLAILAAAAIVTVGFLTGKRN